MNLNPRFALIAGSALVAFGVGMAVVACDAAAANVTPPAATATPERNVQKEPEFTPTAAPTEAPPAEKPAPADEPASDPAPTEAPRVLWMRSSHAGPGVVTIRLETNVPTTVTIKSMTNQVGEASFFSEDLTELATEHVTSVPAGAPGRYKARIEDEQGDVAWAELRYKTDPQGIDWATGGAAPKLVAPNSKQLDITYAFPAGHPTKLSFAGEVYVFFTDGDCTTADACPGELVGSMVEAPATGNAQLESHKAIASIPGAAFDYQVVVGQPLFENSSTMVFIQLEIRGDQLPKPKLQGPGEIKSN